MTEDRLVSTPHGPARFVVRRARGARATLVLSHGAGAGIDTPDLRAIADALPAQGVSVFLLEQPWRLAGRKVAPRPPVLDEGLRAACATLRPRTPLVVGGRSAGARSAARSARHVGATACLALSFPLHPPGKPERSRLEELRGSGVPTRVIQGARDAFGRPEEFPGDVALVSIPDADHGFAVPKSAERDRRQTADLVAAAAADFVLRDVLGNLS